MPRPAGSSPSVAAHALTVGAVGGLIIGMMTRTARGHTARPLRADRMDVACYLLVLAAGVVRVAVPLRRSRVDDAGGDRLGRPVVGRLRAVCRVLLEGADAAAPGRQARLTPANLDGGARRQ